MIGNSLLDCNIRFDLIWSEFRMVVAHLTKLFGCSTVIAGKHLSQGSGSVELGDLTGPAERVADVVEPRDLAVRGKEERHVVTPEIQGVGAGASGIPFGLSENVLRAQRELLGLYDTQHSAVPHERVICRAVFSGIFPDGAAVAGTQWTMLIICDDLPARRRQLRVNKLPAGLPLADWKFAVWHQVSPLWVTSSSNSVGTMIRWSSGRVKAVSRGVRTDPRPVIL